MLPNFLIVGAMKAATSTLRDVLNTHPDIYLAPRELHYFIDSGFERGLRWYEQQFEAAASAVAVGEKSPSYCYAPEAPCRIAATLPDVRLVFLLREPGARSYSNYWQRVAFGEEKKSFDAVIEAELSGNRRSIWSMYLKRSLYLEQVDRILEQFPRGNVYLGLYEDFQREPHRMLAEICRFLGVRDDFSFDVERRSNVTSIPVSRKVARITRRLLGEGAAASAISRLNIRRRSGYPRMSPATRERLDRYFAPFNEQLAKRTGLDLGVWRG